MSRSLTSPLARAPGSPRSARHSQQGCQGTREAGAAPQAPCGVAPNPVGTVVDGSPRTFPLPGVRATITAVLTTFEGQAVFRLLEPAPDLQALTYGGLFRLRRGSRVCPPMGETS